MHRSFALIGVLTLFTSCSISLPFNNRTTFESVSNARALQARQKGPVKLIWAPSNFPDRVDVQGASGFVGGGTKTSVPTGVAIASRVMELLDAAVGISPGAENQILIRVVYAESKFEFSSASVWTGSNELDFGSCSLELEFVIGSKTWKKNFSASHRESGSGSRSATGVLEKAWDEVALDVVKEITTNL